MPLISMNKISVYTKFNLMLIEYSIFRLSYL